MLLISSSIYYLVKIKISNAEFKNRNYNCAMPYAYKRWLNSIKLMKVLLLLELFYNRNALGRPIQWR